MQNRIAQKLNLKPSQVKVVLELLEAGSTIPFIARYRKDVTGALDEVQVQQIETENKMLVELEQRRAFILKTIDEQGKMSDDLKKAIEGADSIIKLEDLYLPYKQKRKTKAATARENGLQPLADILMAQTNVDVDVEAAKYINEKVADKDAALQGARDIIAEQVSETPDIREMVRKLFADKAMLVSKVVEDKQTDAAKYNDYFDYSESVKTVPSHRTLAILRGFLEGFLRLSIEPAEAEALEALNKQIVKAKNATTPHIEKAVKDSYRRLLQPAMETELRSKLKAGADEEAINVFAENLRQLLLSSPLGSKRVLAIDPGYRTGCKTVCLDEKGELLETDLIFVHEQNKIFAAENTIKKLVEKYQIEVIAIGDGTAGRETEQFIKKMNLNLPIFLVNEDGASIYSASEVAREEFPDKDITVRGAVSIGRRLMDPLAELVKIDPKSIGVGQYQHDVNQTKLKEKLDQTVVSCVNNVGVNLNTASKHLLAYVSGIGPSIAENIVKYRRENGQFISRKQLMDVPRLGAKAFEQSAGFLRIPSAKNPLDASAVHPEAYGLVEQIAEHLNMGVEGLMGNKELLDKLDAKDLTTDEFGIHTVKDVIAELKKPGLDPRAEAQHFEFGNVFSIEEMLVGMELPGLVTNLTKFGAFVDVGVKQDGLVHVSEIAHKYISDPSEVLRLNQKVMVKVLEVDKARKRIALSIKQLLPASEKKQNSHSYQPRQNAKPQNFGEALSALKNKFGKN